MMPYQIVADVADERRRALLAEARSYEQARAGRPPRRTVAEFVLRLLPPRPFQRRSRARESVTQHPAGRVLRGVVPLSRTAARPRGGQR